VRIKLPVPTATRGDIDNRTKAILDLLVSRALTVDDRHCQHVSVWRADGLMHCEVNVMRTA
jgi:Holliday junction resolvase RusA-like endonuclease